MAEEKREILYVKSSLWRAVDASATIVNGLTGPAGQEFVARFSHEWVDVEKETFIAEVTPLAGGGTTLTVKGTSQVVMSQIYRIEEVGVKMPPETAVMLTIGLLGQFAQMQAPHKLSDQQLEKLRAAFAPLSKS